MIRTALASIEAWRACRLEPAGLARLQRRRLAAELTSAWETSALYRELWAGTRPPGPDDLGSLPVITKSDLQEAGPRARSERWTGEVVDHTSGTTGEPLEVRHDPRAAVYFGAVWMRSHVAYGLRPWHTTAYFRNFPDPVSLPERLGIFRSHHLDIEADDATLHRQLTDLAPTCLGGYPSHIAELLGRFGSADLADLGVRFVATGAEELTDGLRHKIERSLGAAVADLYGTTEFGCVGYECRFGSRHVNEDAVLVEVVDDDGAPLPADKAGSLVVTSLWGRAMPFVRYRIGDRARIRREACGCGTAFALLEELRGRDDRAVVTPDGRRLTSTRLCADLRLLTDLRQYQIRQVTPSMVVVKVAFDGTNDAVAVDVHRLLARQLGPSCQLEVERVARIDRTVSGKVPDLVPLPA